MGAVAIWCMHYVGNRATIMCDGEPTLAIQYSPGFTAGSFFLAVIGVAMAFYFSNMSGTVTPLGTIMGGMFMGGAICGMHYLGQVGIANYQASYASSYVTGAALIAVTASTVALTIFFFFKSKWTNSWYRRIGSAVLLATAVSGMHWCATAGTEYRLISTEMNRGPTAERVIKVVTVLVRPMLAELPTIDFLAGYLLLHHTHHNISACTTLETPIKAPSTASHAGVRQF